MSIEAQLWIFLGGSCYKVLFNNFNHPPPSYKFKRKDTFFINALETLIIFSHGKPSWNNFHNCENHGTLQREAVSWQLAPEKSQFSLRKFSTNAGVGVILISLIDG